MPRHTSLSVEESINKLKRASQLIHCRRDIKKHEEQRVKEAIAMLVANKNPNHRSKRDFKNKYRHFLLQVIERGGRPLVILCAIGLGKSTICAMNEANRLLLPLEIGKQKLALLNSTLETLEEKLWTTCHRSSHSQSGCSFLCIGSVNGPHPTEVSHNLTPHTSHNQTRSFEAASKTVDVRNQLPISLRTNQFPLDPQSGRFYQLTAEDLQDVVALTPGSWLTFPFTDEYDPYITIPVSKELGYQFAVHRPQAIFSEDTNS